MTRPDARSTLAALLALSLACARYDADDFVLSPERVQQYLQVDTVSLARSLPADGFSTTLVKAHINPNADQDKRTLVFTTSLGTIRGGTAATGGGQQVTVDGSGDAQVELVSPTTAGTALVRVSVSGVAGLSREVTVSFTQAAPDSMLRLVAAPIEALADSATLSTFTAEIAPGLSADRRKVRFTTTNGVFAATNQPTVEVEADQSNRASARLRSPIASGSARIVASAAGVSDEADIFFRVAPPEQVLLSPAKTRIKGDGSEEVTIDLKLLRAIGVPTLNTSVTLRATQGDSTGAPVGTFRGFPLTNNRGEAQASLSISTPYRGLVTIRAIANTGGPAGYATIEVVNP